MTDISVRRSVQYSENRSWLLGPHGTDPGSNPNVTLDVALFEGLYPNGFIPSGIVLAKRADGVCGPYDPAAEDELGTAYGHLFSSLQVRSGTTRIAGAAVVHGFVHADRLPVESGKGALDASARADLSGIHYES